MSQAELRQHSMELRAFRHWVVQLDQDALAGTELLLRSWRADASGEVCSPGVQAWEEIDSRAVVFGPSNALGATAEVRQEPGQLIAFQVGRTTGQLRHGSWSDWYHPIRWMCKPTCDIAGWIRRCGMLHVLCLLYRCGGSSAHLQWT